MPLYKLSNKGWYRALCTPWVSSFLFGGNMERTAKQIKSELVKLKERKKILETFQTENQETLTEIKTTNEQIKAIRDELFQLRLKEELERRGKNK